MFALYHRYIALFYYTFYIGTVKEMKIEKRYDFILCVVCFE